MALDPVALLEGLLYRYSPSNEEGEAVGYLVEYMAQAGFQAWVDPAGNAIGLLGDGPMDMVMLGHIDTVPGFIPVRRDGDRLYGRGAVDAKGPLAAFASAAAQAGALPDRRIVVIGAVAEEGDSHGAEYVAAHYGPGGELPAGRPCRPACLIIGEPSGWDRITLGYKGSLWATYRVERPVAHSAARDESASEAAVSFWNKVVAYAAAYNEARQAQRLFDQLSHSLRAMNSHSDGFIDSATLQFNVRLPPGLAVDALAADLQDMAGDAGLTTLGGAMPAYRADKNTPLVRAFLAAIRAKGGSPSFTVKTGSSDMNLVAPGWGVASLAYGPGDSVLDHTPEEHIALTEYAQGVTVLASVLQNTSPLAPSQ